MNHDEDGCHGATRVIDAPQHALIVAIFSNLIEGLFIARGFLPPPTVTAAGHHLKPKVSLTELLVFKVK